MKVLFLYFLVYMACNQNSGTNKSIDQSSSMMEKMEGMADTPVVKLTKPNEVWKKELNEQEYYVLREKGTERAFTGDLLNIHDKGTFICRACKLPLFDSQAKFESGTGWPSFFKPLSKFAVSEISDSSHGMSRTEVVCARCDGHLGHVFDDGPKPTGLRYCMNSVSMDFVKKGAGQ